MTKDWMEKHGKQVLKAVPIIVKTAQKAKSESPQEDIKDTLERAMGFRDKAKLWYALRPLETELKKELKTKKSLSEILKDPELRMEALQSSSVSTIINSPSFLEKVDKHTGISEILDRCSERATAPPTKTPRGRSRCP
jgi:hypothetical protein